MRPVRNPFDESVIDEVPDFGPEVLDATLEGLQLGSSDIIDLSREEHHAIFVNLFDIVKGKREELIQLLQIEQGKPRHEATMEFEASRHSIEALADNPSLIGPGIGPLADEPAARGWQGFTLRQPHGIVATLTPVVHPLLFPTIQLCYALAAGNAVLFKPARVTPLIGLKLVEMLLEAGIPPGAIACLPGEGRILGKAICSDRRLNYISCMGRIPTVQTIRKVSEFIPTQLQWGCVSSVIVDKTANLDRFTESFMRSSFDNAGQSAFTASWIAAEDEIHDEVVDRLAAAMKTIRLGNPIDKTTRMGPVTSALSKKSFDLVMESELASGAEVVTGGTREKRLIQPTLFRHCVPGESILAKQEVRGPVVGVSRIGRTEDAIRMLQHQRYHILSLFTDDEGEVINQAMHLPFENIHVNGIPTWRDGLVCVPGHPPRSGLRSSYDRVRDFSRCRDVVCH